MKTNKICNPTGLKILGVLTAILLTSQLLVAQNWMDNSWAFRRAITVPNPAGTDLAEFQVKIGLTGANFDFAKALNDGRDIRLTASDGTTPVPYWIESWDATGQEGNIWVKVPLIPVAGTTVYIYYGNPSVTNPDPEPVETPPSGPYTKDPSNPIVPIGDTGLGLKLLAENIVYDDVTGHYWMVFSNYRVSGTSTVGLVWSDDPTDPDAWHWHSGSIISDAQAPHIIKHNGTWYIFYYQSYNIQYVTCSTIDGTYSSPTIVLSPSDAWEIEMVHEPCVFQRSDGKWILIYMGNSGGITEQVGYAIADNITGPYTKFAGNPCIQFGPAGSYDAGTIADPWVYEYKGVYYIGYTVSPTNQFPWQTALVTTSDWQTFTKHGVILPYSPEFNAFRGAVTRIGDEYVFPYTTKMPLITSDYQMAIATQPVYQVPPSTINDPDAVFDFFDNFDGTSVDQTKWTFASGSSAQTELADGLMTLNATSTYVLMRGSTQFGMDFIGETRAQHPSAGTYWLIAEVGFSDVSWNTVRIADYYIDNSYWQRQSKLQAGANTWVNMTQTADQNWHIFHVYRESAGTAGFQIDDNPVETVTENVPTMDLPPFLMSFGNTNQFIVDWTRVRKWAGSDPVSVAGSEENLITQWTGSTSSEWATASNWTAGVPSSWNNITIPATTNSPLLNGSLTLGSTASLTLDPGGALTVNGDLNNSGVLTIGSTLTSSGSLIVNGASTGNITYNRQLKPGSNATRDWHLVSAPVQNNTETNATKISTVYQWSETTGTWNTTSITSSLPGHGYNIRQTAGSDGLISFTGSLVNGDILLAASSPYADAIGPGGNYFTRAYVTGRSLENLGGKGWNLLGNPYASAIVASEFIDANYNVTPSLSQFDPNYVALYLFDGTDRRYYYIGNPTGWSGGGELAEVHVQAGQAFFVLAMNDNSEFLFTRAMQEHSIGTDMLKSAGIADRWPGLQLKVRYGTDESMTTIVFNEKMTAGVDPGYDVGLFKSGQELEVYTTLVLKDNSVNFARQALPVTHADTIVVPVGIDSKKGGEVTLSGDLTPLGNYKFWLEDRTAAVFTNLNSNSYTVMLPANTYGTGRFFIIASTNMPTGIEADPDDGGQSLRIWMYNDQVIIKGEISNGAICEIFDINGRKVLMINLNDGELNTFDIPEGIHGVVLVRVTDGVKVTTRKIAIL